LFNLKNKYKGSEFYEFGMRDITYNLNETNPAISIQIGHYNSDEIIQIHFSEVYHHSIMTESFIWFVEEENWDEDIFIAKAKNSQLIKWLSTYSLLGSETVVKPKDLDHYRVYTQDHFVEVLTSVKPKISFQNKT